MTWIANDILLKSSEERGKCAILARTNKVLDLVGTRPDESAFNEFEEERSVWRLLLSDITKKFEGDDVGLH